MPGSRSCGRSTASAPVTPNPAVFPCHAVVIAGPKNGMRCRSRVATSTVGVITGTNANTDDVCFVIAAELWPRRAPVDLGAGVLDEPSRHAAA